MSRQSRCQSWLIWEEPDVGGYPPLSSKCRVPALYFPRDRSAREAGPRVGLRPAQEAALGFAYDVVAGFGQEGDDPQGGSIGLMLCLRRDQHVFQNRVAETPSTAGSILRREQPQGCTAESELDMNKGLLAIAQDILNAIWKLIRGGQGQPAPPKVRLDGRRGYGDGEIPPHERNSDEK